jgi:hypothetical protein
MSRLAWPFVTVAVLTLALAALSYGLIIKGYSMGAMGIERLDALAGPLTFMPLAALYSLAAALVVLLPIRSASAVHTNGSVPVFSATLLLLAAIVGLVIARTIFVDREAFRALLDWRYLFAVAVIVVHMSTNHLRQNLLLRTLAFVALIGAALACLYWSFRL